ncbi:hypothetical protein V6N11_070730 [Hibiscus sabdariffa]|uniref:Cucumisin n=1 Tax=Hibiscus sabdariffa TaxID=183260 RepID=A0ABR2QFY3_9ROSI
MAALTSSARLPLIGFTLFVLICCCYASSENRQVYIVYMGHLPKGEVSITSLHTSLLQEVVPSSVGSDVLVYSYHRSFNGFAAKLTTDEAETLRVAASTIDRKFVTKVKLGNGEIYEGTSINTFDLKEKMYPFITGGDALNHSQGPIPADSRFCYADSLNKTLVKGKIILCDYYTDSNAPIEVGAVGAVYQTADYKDHVFAYGLPLSNLNLDDGKKVFNYANGTENPTATIFKTQVEDQFAPFVVSFSSRGPNPITADLLKPDLTAPGVDILAAWSGIPPLTDTDGYTSTQMETITGNTSSCSKETNGTVWDLNYPSFALSTTPGNSVTRVFHRTVTNVGSAVSTYNAVVKSPPQLVIKVQPSVLCFKSLGQKLSFTVSVSAEVGNSIISGALIWDDGVHQVRSPIVATDYLLTPALKLINGGQNMPFDMAYANLFRNQLPPRLPRRCRFELETGK